MKIIPLCSFFLLAVVAAPALAQTKKPAARPAISAPQQAAKTWLALVDKARYDDSWKAGAKLFQKSVTAAQWADAVAKGRKPFGALRSRTLLKGQRLTSPPGLPKEEYAILTYRANFESGAHAVETVSLSRRRISSGAWTATISRAQSDTVEEPPVHPLPIEPTFAPEWVHYR